MSIGPKATALLIINAIDLWTDPERMIVTPFEPPANPLQFSPKNALLLTKASRFQLPLPCPFPIVI